MALLRPDFLRLILLIVLNGIEISQNLTAREHLYRLLIVLNGIEMTKKVYKQG